MDKATSGLGINGFFGGILEVVLRARFELARPEGREILSPMAVFRKTPRDNAESPYGADFA